VRLVDVLVLVRERYKREEEEETTPAWEYNG